jgi:uncharacterized phage protein (TIGR01671 family)
MSQREIKFRVWNPKYKDFRYWGFIEPNKSIFAGIPSGSGFDIETCRKYSQQFTGLLDRNGKEIYEGDIIKGWWNNYQGIFEIVWDEGAFGIVLEKEYCPCLYEVFPDRHFEIIGNIYENPDLMEERK